MKVKLFVIVAILVSVSFAQENHHKDRKKYDDKELREIVSMISSNFEKLEREYLTKLSYRDYVRAKSLLIESYDLLNSIPLAEENELIEPMPISNTDFSGLVESIKNESFDEDKLSVISIAAKYHFFLVEQVLQLIDLYPYSDSKIEIIKYTYPNVIDKNNSHQLINAFTFSSDKDKVREIINSFPGN